MNKRIVIIKSCWECPFHMHDDQREEIKWGKNWCTKMNIELTNADNIPDKCPLPKDIKQ